MNVNFSSLWATCPRQSRLSQYQGQPTTSKSQRRPADAQTRCSSTTFGSGPDEQRNRLSSQKGWNSSDSSGLDQHTKVEKTKVSGTSGENAYSRPNNNNKKRLEANNQIPRRSSHLPRNLFVSLNKPVVHHGRRLFLKKRIDTTLIGPGLQHTAT